MLFPRQLAVDEHLAGEAAERPRAQRPEPGGWPGSPSLVDVGDDCGLAGGEEGADLLDEVDAEADLEQVVGEPAEAAE